MKEVSTAYFRTVLGLGQTHMDILQNIFLSILTFNSCANSVLETGFCVSVWACKTEIAHEHRFLCNEHAPEITTTADYWFVYIWLAPFTIK